MQDGLVYPTFFNMVVDNVIITWLAITVVDHRVAHDGLEETVERCLVLFYDEDGIVGSREAYWLQNLMNVLVGTLQRYGLAANVSKSRKMTCQPSALRLGISE